MNQWRGTIAFVGRESVDHRIIDALNVLYTDGVRPLVDMDSGGSVGTVEGIAFVGPGVHGTGRTTLKPGTYSVGIDLSHVEIVSMHEDEPVHVDGRLWAVFVNRIPAWPECSIVVEEE